MQPSLAGLDHDAVQQILDPDPAVERRDTCVEPCDGAPPLRQAFSLMTYSSSSLMLPSLSWSNTTFDGHQLGEARGRRSSSAVLLEQDGAGVGFDQDRVRRSGVEFVLLAGVAAWTGPDAGQRRKAKRNGGKSRTGGFRE